MHPHMLVPNGKPCCIKYMMWVFGLHTNDLYYRRRADGAKRRDRSVKDVSIQAWFEALKQTIDQMPDENVFQVPLPFKKSLYHLYLLDCETYP